MKLGRALAMLVGRQFLQPWPQEYMNIWNHCSDMIILMDKDKASMRLILGAVEGCSTGYRNAGTLCFAH